MPTWCPSAPRAGRSRCWRPSHRACTHGRCRDRSREMKREDLRELHNMAKIANLSSIMKRGILSHRRMEQLGIAHESVARPGIQEVRATRRVPGGRPLHDYACIYFNARNAMLNVVLRDVDHSHGADDHQELGALLE